MKDNFDIKQFLVENRLTESSRGNERRQRFGKTLLNDNVLLESICDVDPDRDGFECWCQDQGIAPSAEARRQYEDEMADMNECDMMDASLDEARVDRDALYSEFVGYASKYGEDKAWKIMMKFHPEIDFNKVNIVPKFARRNKEMNIAQEKARINRVPTYDQHSVSSDSPTYDKYGNRTGNTVIDEVGYADEDDDYVDDDFLGARGSNADLGIDNDTKAAAAAKRGMAGTDLDVDAPEDAPEFSDQPDSEEDFQDPEDMNTQDADVTAPSSDVDPLQIFGKNAPYVEVLVDDLGQYLRGPKGKWRVNVSTNLLRRAVDSVRSYMEEFSYPKRGFLLVPNKLGNYDEVPVLSDYTVESTPKAVVYVHREPIN